MQFFNGEINKICGINIIQKIFLPENKRKTIVKDENVTSLDFKNNTGLVKILENKRNSNSLYQYKYKFNRSILNNDKDTNRATFYKIKTLDNFHFFEKCIDFQNIELAKYIWKAIGMNPKGKINTQEFLNILVQENERRNYLEKMEYIEKALQIKNRFKFILNKIFGNFIKNSNFNINIQEDKILDYFDLIIIECPTIRYFENILFNDIKSSSFEDLTKFLFVKMTEILNFHDNELSNVFCKVVKVALISENMFKLWSKEFIRLKSSNFIENFQFKNGKKVESLQKNLLYLILIYGYLLANKLENNEFKDQEISTLLNQFTELLENAKNTVFFNQIKFLIELIILHLSDESIQSHKLKLHILKLYNKIIEYNPNNLIKTLIISNIIKRIDDYIIQNKENILYEEFISAINKYFFQENQINGNKLLKNDLERLTNKLDITNLELLLKKYLIKSNMINNTIELILDKIQNQILSNIDTWKENHFDFNHININLLNQVIQLQKDKNLSINYLQKYIMLHFTKTLRILEEKKVINDEKKLFRSNFEPSKVNTLKFISMINSKFDQYCEYEREESNFIKIVNSYSLPKITQSILMDNLSKNSCDWVLINEGIQFLNKYLLSAFNSNLLENINEISEFSKLIMNEIKKRFINDESNQIELKFSIPKSNIYFEILRLIHNASYISNPKVKENTNIHSIQLLNQGIIPFSLNFKEENPDFLLNKISDYFNNKNNVKTLVNSSHRKNINLIFIHGFLGSAYKSWNIDISKESKTPTILDNNFQSNNIPEYKEYNLNFKLNSDRNSNIISKLEKHNYLIWPRILLTENKNIKMFAIDYSHQIFNQNQSVTLKSISEEIYKKLLKANILPKDIKNHSEKNNIIICHSMGGILLKLIIANHPETVKSIKGIIFFGTPHFGTNLHSNIIKFFKKKVPSYLIELSSKFNIEKLRKLNLKFQKLIYSIPKQERPLIYSFSEYLPCKIPFLFNISKIIVPHFNSNPFIGNFFILKTDHSFINKLTIYKNDIRYLLIQNLIDL
ncbi:uncharacterized protein cubi_01331 [Cryptosporidium ubiquitum]|uniref:GPI inositol-deacylase n=1 Tax=Cryptosporidium ubiquitum TaxID=857276 RepID=A0A1J4MCQ3_9CRYT|nr:uncharacterized protein cubi_01331 [Cryptosporidium ubiquitum]OII71998.1 hypothetical protein cubi_01331 [Cryptosporidium ubiquitum]